MKEKSAENVVPACLSSILAHKGGSITVLFDNGTEFKYIALNEVCDQLDNKRLFSSPFHTQGNVKVENIHNFLKRAFTKFLDYSNHEWDQLLVFTCYCYNIFPGSNGTQSPFFLMFDEIQQKDSYLTSIVVTGIIAQMKARWL